MRKKIIALIIVIILAFSGGPTLAAQIEPLQQYTTEVSSPALEEPNLVLISSIVPVLNVSGTTANYSLSVTCVTSVNSIRATLQIQRFLNGRWTNYEQSWVATSSTWFLSTSGSRTVTSGGTYRLRVTVRASNETMVGTATAYS